MTESNQKVRLDELYVAALERIDLQAQELQQLREEIEMWRAGNAWKRIEGAEAERDALRLALEEMIDLIDGTPESIARRSQDIWQTLKASPKARAALTQSPEPQEKP